MNDTSPPAAAASLAPEAPPLDPAVTLPVKRALAEKTLGELFTLMQVPASVEVRDAADGGISVAVKLEAELPGVQAGRRSHFVDALQFLVNKLVNKPGTPRHWVSVGMGAHPEPRGPKPPRPAASAQVTGAAAPAPHVARAAAQAQAQARPSAPAQATSGPLARSPKERTAAPGRHGEADERKLEGPADSALRTLAQVLAKKSAQLGRYYAVVGMKPPERGELLKGSDGVEGVKVAAEGEGRNRRVVFTPAKPAPMPKRTLPVEDDEDEDE